MAKKDGGDADAPKEKKKRGKLKLLIALVVVLAAAGGTYVFLFSGGGKAAATPAPQPGVVVKLDSITLNLADGRYLKLGLALQATTKAKPEELDGSKALDEAITVFTGRKMSELGNAVTRDQLKATLVAKVKRLYEGEVMDVYFREFVMQ